MTKVARGPKHNMVNGNCDVCGAGLEGHPACDACGILCGFGHIECGLSEYREHMLCSHCLGRWKNMDRRMGRETLWREFLHGIPVGVR